MLSLQIKIFVRFLMKIILVVILASAAVAIDDNNRVDCHPGAITVLSKENFFST